MNKLRRFIVINESGEHFIDAFEIYEATLYKPNKIPLHHVGLSIRTYNCCKYNGVSYLEQLTNFSESDIFSWRNAGKKTVTEIIAVLNKYGLKLVLQ